MATKAVTTTPVLSRGFVFVNVSRLLDKRSFSFLFHSDDSITLYLQRSAVNSSRKDRLCRSS